tara:strand:- start:4113 stop:4871 length:759 start_codon:yes stop_codon:yes gene_type:complete
MQKFPLKYEDIDLYFDPVKHTYVVNNKIVRSVTGVTSMGVPKPQLINWLVNTPMFEAKSQLNKLLDEGKKLDRVTLERVFHDSSAKTEKLKNEGALVGSVVHGLIEDYLKGKEIPEQSDKKVIACWNTFLKWWETQGYEPVEIEKKIYSKNYTYAGTLDLVVKDKKGNLVLIDIKTSNHVSFDYHLQLNAYKFAYEEETKSPISKALIVRLPKQGGKIEIVDGIISKSMFDAFLSAKYMTHALVEYSNIHNQ